MARRILVTGAAGMLGSELLLRVPADCVAFGTDLRAPNAGSPAVAVVGTDLADDAAVARLVREHGPFDGVIHGAAYTAVDQAETEEALALRVNARACAVLARACARARIPLVAVSTDFVFDGEGVRDASGALRPYREDDPPRPLAAYGRTKLAGELLALAEHPGGARIARTQWLYGPRGKHFPGTIVRAAKEKGALKVVDDQRGAPTTTLELAPALWDLVLADAPSGIYHAACEGVCSWYDLAKASLEEAGLAHVPCAPCATAEFPRPAKRPAYSALDSSKLAELRGRRLKGWREALRDFFAAGA